MQASLEDSCLICHLTSTSNAPYADKRVLEPGPMIAAPFARRSSALAGLGFLSPFAKIMHYP